MVSLAAILVSACGEDEDFCSEGQLVTFALDAKTLGRKEWDGDTFWTSDLSDRIKLICVDYPDISGANDLTKASNSSKANYKNWQKHWNQAYNTPQLNSGRITTCFNQGVDAIRKKLSGQPVCLVKDPACSESDQYSRSLRRVRFLDNGQVTDLGAWLLKNGYAVPWDYRATCKQGCSNWSMYSSAWQSLLDNPSGCLWK